MRRKLVVTALLLSFSSCKTSHQTSCKSNSCSVRSPTPSLTEEIKTNRLTNDQKSALIIHRIQEITEQNVHGSLGGKNPAHLSRGGWFFEGDVLCWNAREDGLVYAKSSQLLGASSYRERMLQPSWQWAAGFRLGLSYQFAQYDHWGLQLMWTYFHNKAHGSVSEQNPDLLAPTWGGAGSLDAPILGSNVTKATLYWKLDYDVLDLELGRNYFVSKAITVHPFTGLRGAWISQDYDVTYQPVFTSSTSMKADVDFKGVGLRLGSDMIWHLSCHFGVVGNFSASLLYGPYQTRQTYQGDVTYVNRQHQDQFQANLETGLGLEWETAFNKDRAHFSGALLYEFSEWFEQNRLIRTATNGTLENSSYQKESGDLGIQGVTLKLRLNY